MMRADKHSGFGLIEVLIALAVVAFGLLALANLQIDFLAGGSEAKARSVALQLAQQKLDDLRSFEQLSSGGSGTFGFDEIASNAGGAEGADGHLLIAANTASLSGVDFTLAWDVTDYYIPPSSAADQTPVEHWDAVNWGTAPSRPDYKLAQITISWTDRDGIARSEAVTGTIAASSPSASGRTVMPPDEGTAPQVAYTPGDRPEIVAVDDGTNTRETTLPDPDVSQNNEFTVTRFDEITYDRDNVMQSRTNFITTNCECNQESTTAEAYTPALRTLDGLQLGTLLDKRVGSRINTGQAGQQSVYCQICCRDHHDKAGEPPHDPFRPDSTEGNDNYPTALGGDHGHAYPDADGNLVAADSGNDNYLEACRFAFINGNLNLLQDWYLEDLTIVESTWLEDEINYNAYAQYVKDFASAYIDAIPGTPTCNSDSFTDYSSYSRPSAGDIANHLSTDFSEPDSIELDPGSTAHFIARAIYIDRMESDLLNAIKCRKNAGEPYLHLIPFHEVNVTKLAAWGVSDPDRGSVTSEPLEDGASHSRGALTIPATGRGSLTLIASMEKSNTGLTDTTPVDWDDESEMEDTIAVKVVSNASGDGPIISGALATGGGTSVAPSQVVIEGVDGAECTRDTDDGYGCTLDIEGDGTITVRNYTPLDNQGEVVDNHVCPMPDRIENAGTIDEYSEFHFDGATTHTMDITIKKANQNC